MPRVILRLCGQASVGPREVDDQSNAAMSVPVSLPGAGKERTADEVRFVVKGEAVIGKTPVRRERSI